MESHQATKLDISGTAKAVISCFQKLGVSFNLNEVNVNWKLTWSENRYVEFVFYETLSYLSFADYC
jgi:hypothetical protein